jgi:Ca2+:H+ antiporter
MASHSDNHANGQSHSALPTHGGEADLFDVAAEGESGRKGFHPKKFLQITWKSSCVASQYVNLLWPFVPVAFVLHFAAPHLHLWVFAMSYVGMVPAANLIGFAGQELARKMPKVAGILIETALGSIVEIVLFLILIGRHEGGEGSSEEGNLIPVIQAAILGSILTNLLLCLGLCFFVGGLRQNTQTFHPSVSEVGTGLLLVAGFGLLIPSAFYSALKSETVSVKAGEFVVRAVKFTEKQLQRDVMQISQVTSVILIIAFGIYLWYNARSQHSIFDEILEADEHKDLDHHDDMAKDKYTYTECFVALVVALTLVTMLADFLVEKIEDVVESGVPDQFLGMSSTCACTEKHS